MPKIIFTAEDDRYLIGHYKDETCDQLARRFKCSAPTISIRLKELGLSKAPKSQKRVWSEEEIAYLRENFPYMPACDIADHLGMSNPTVTRKARELGLEKSSTYSQIAFCQCRYVKTYKNNLTRYAV